MDPEILDHRDAHAGHARARHHLGEGEAREAVTAGYAGGLHAGHELFRVLPRVKWCDADGHARAPDEG